MASSSLTVLNQLLRPAGGSSSSSVAGLKLIRDLNKALMSTQSSQSSLLEALPAYDHATIREVLREMGKQCSELQQLLQGGVCFIAFSMSLIFLSFSNFKVPQPYLQVRMTRWYSR